MWKGNILASSEVENVKTLILQGDDDVDDVQLKNNMNSLLLIHHNGGSVPNHQGARK
jgi:hypothetical protein